MRVSDSKFNGLSGSEHGQRRHADESESLSNHSRVDELLREGNVFSGEVVGQSRAH